MSGAIKNLIKNTPVIGDLARSIKKLLVSKSFSGSESYWVNRYSDGGNSGSGSYGKLAEFKAEVLNQFVAEHAIESIMEFGCGDGNQLRLAHYPNYLGFDVSARAIELCRSVFTLDSTKAFKLVADYSGERAQLSMSLDVIFHLVEDSVYNTYMQRLFDSAERFVIIYSSNRDSSPAETAPHEKHRMFTKWVEQNRHDWRLLKHIPNRYPYKGDSNSGSIADFYIYARKGAST